MPVPVAIPLGPSGISGNSLWPAAVARPGERRLEFAFDHRLDELAHPAAQAGFDRVKPVVEKKNRGLGFQLQGRRLRAIAGMAWSPPTRERRDRLGFTTRRLRHL